MTHTPKGRTLLAIGVIAVFLRIVVFAVTALRLGLTFHQYADQFDGHSYLVVARDMCGEKGLVDEYDRRIFPGLAILVAAVHRLGAPIDAAGVGIDWISAGLAAALAGRLFGDARVGWATALLPPHYLMNSTMTMTEAPLLALSLFGLVLAKEARPWLGGAVAGLAGIIRPMACFAVVGEAAQLIWEGRRGGRPGVGVPGNGRRRGWPAAMVFAGCAGVFFVAALLAIAWWRGDPLNAARIQINNPGAYGGQLLTWPFVSLLTTPGKLHKPIGHVIYIWIHVVIVLIGCIAAVIACCHRGRDSRDVLAMPWLLGNSAFVLCLGSIWGYCCFHRFMVPAMPALAWSMRGILPRGKWGWIAVAIGATAIASFSVSLTS